MQGTFYTLKGEFGLFEVGLYDVLTDSWCISYSKRLTAHPQLREPDRSTSLAVKQCTAVDRVSNKIFSHIKMLHLKESLFIIS